MDPDSDPDPLRNSRDNVDGIRESIWSTFHFPTDVQRPAVHGGVSAPPTRATSCATCLPLASLLLATHDWKPVRFREYPPVCRANQRCRWVCCSSGSAGRMCGSQHTCTCSPRTSRRFGCVPVQGLYIAGEQTFRELQGKARRQGPACRGSAERPNRQHRASLPDMRLGANRSTPGTPLCSQVRGHLSAQPALRLVYMSNRAQCKSSHQDALHWSLVSESRWKQKRQVHTRSRGNRGMPRARTAFLQAPVLASLSLTAK